MHIQLPQLALVVLIGPSGAGKTTFSRKHFLPTEVLSSDFCREMISDDENNQTVTGEAFDLLHYIGAKRLALGRIAVVDATNVQPEARKPLVELARRYHVVPVAIVFNVSERLCQDRNSQRADRAFGPHVIRQQVAQLRRSLRGLKREGFRYIFELSTPEEIEGVSIERVPLWTDKRGERGPFDIIGDIHGCCDEFELLLGELGYRVTCIADGPLGGPVYAHPEGRRAIFVGDLVDRGPRVLDVVRLVHNMVASGAALCVPGNHDIKLLKKLQGKQVQVTHGLAQTLAEIDGLPESDGVREKTCKALAEFLNGLVGHYVLDDGGLVVAHAGMKAEYQGRASARVRDFALYGETTGETDEYGLPVRYNWAAEYRGAAMVVYGHTPVPEAEWLNRTINIDTGCVFGGKLTALRYPERELIAVKAAKTYCEPARPLLSLEQQAEKLSAQHAIDEVLDAADVRGKRIITTRLHANVTIREENAVAALEVMSRFAANPKWLIYLPPTMSPCETSREEALLEHPQEAFGYFRSQGVPTVIVEEKHMGSRAVVVVCRDEAAARDRFGITTGETGIVVTRTGRKFFNDETLEAQFLERVRAALTSTGFWEQFRTEWVCLDCELMPWSAKAQELLRSQYAAVGAAAQVSLPAAAVVVAQTATRLGGEALEKAELVLRQLRTREANIQRYVTAYRHYCWNVDSLNDLRLAPFHLLATEGQVHVDQNHVWHMQTLAKICEADPTFLLATPFQVVELLEPESESSAVRWWEELTSRGGEGMVVKPLDFVVRGKRGLGQPAVKCRGQEYLRIIYGPEYTAPEHLKRLRSRGLAGKRSLPLREFALGVESLERFVRKEPLRRVHECVFGVLALESEPVDPRL